MTVRELKNALNNFDDDATVVIGMRQLCGSDFAMRIGDIEEHKIFAFRGNDFKSVVIEQYSQCGTVDWNDTEWEED